MSASFIMDGRTPRKPNVGAFSTTVDDVTVTKRDVSADASDNVNMYIIISIIAIVVIGVAAFGLLRDGSRRM